MKIVERDHLRRILGTLELVERHILAEGIAIVEIACGIDPLVSLDSSRVDVLASHRQAFDRCLRGRELVGGVGSAQIDEEPDRISHRRRAQPRQVEGINAAHEQIGILLAENLLGEQE